MHSTLQRGSMARNVSHPELKPNARRIATKKHQKHGASLLDNLTLMVPEARCGRCVAEGCRSTVAQCDDIDGAGGGLARMRAETESTKTAATCNLLRACPIALRIAQHLGPRLPPTPPISAYHALHPIWIAYTSRHLHAKTRIDAPPCRRRIIPGRLLLLSRVLTHRSLFLDTPGRTCSARY
jgi:hypothetical protein